MWQKMKLACSRGLGDAKTIFFRLKDVVVHAGAALWRATLLFLAALWRAFWTLATIVVCWKLWTSSAPVLEKLGLSLWWAMLGVGLVGTTMVLIHPPKVLLKFGERLKPSERAQKAIDALRWPVWIGCAAVGTVWIWSVWHGALGDNWTEAAPEVMSTMVPLPYLGAEMTLGSLFWVFFAVGLVISLLSLPSSLPLLAIHAIVGGAVVTGADVPLALIPTVAFAVSSVMAGRLYAWKGAPRWALGFRWVPRGQRKRKYKIDILRFGLYKKDGKRFSLFRFLNAAVLIVSLLATVGASVTVDHFKKDLPKDLSAATAYRPIVTTEVLYDDGSPMCSFSVMNRKYVPLERIPAHVRRAVYAAEDDGFRRHAGFDTISIMRAFRANRDSGETRQGASTITQQVAKMMLLSPERTYERKFKELLLAVMLERRMSKDEIEEIYLTQTYFGRNAYGVQAAAETYFAKDVSELTLAEAALLAGLPKAPSRDAPDKHFERAKARQKYVLGRMRALGYVSESEMRQALDEDLAVFVRQVSMNRTGAATPCEYVRLWAQEVYGFERVFEEGLVIQTTFNANMQLKAIGAVQFGLLDIERRLGFMGHEGSDSAFNGLCEDPEAVADHAIEPGAIVMAVLPRIEVCVRGNRFPLDADDAKRVDKWRRETGGELLPGHLLTVRLETRMEGKGDGTKFVRYALVAHRTLGPHSLQAALVAVEPETGFLKAMVGGYDFNENQYNNAAQAHRQVGSSIKPFIYLADQMEGGTVDEIVNDHPVCYSTASGMWCPQNYRGPRTVRQYRGRVRKDEALAHSLNSVSVQMAAKVGVPRVVQVMRALGIRSEIVPVLPISVGAADLTPLEHTYAYATLAANGRAMPSQHGSKHPGIFVTKVTAKRGNSTLYEYAAEPAKQAVPAADAYAVTHLMRQVVRYGTGKRVRELGRPAAGKTGTTNDFKDAWFMGYTADLAVGVWVGRQTPAPIADEATGGAVALPIWLAFMQAAHPKTSPREFPVPSDVVLMPDSDGDPLPFARGHVPTKRLGAPERKADH